MWYMTITAIREQHDTCHGKPGIKKERAQSRLSLFKKEFLEKVRS